MSEDFANPIDRSFKELEGWKCKGCDIVKLIYLSQEAVDDIKIDFRKYKKHFKDETNEWFCATILKRMVDARIEDSV